MWAESIPYPVSQDGRAVMQRLTSWSQFVPVEWLRPWVHAWEVNWGLFFSLFVLAFVLRFVGGRMQGIARVRSYRLWRARLTGGSYADFPIRGIVTNARNSRTYQRGLQILKWRLLPFIAAMALLFTLLWLSLAAVTQFTWSFNDPMLCNGLEPAQKGTSVSIAFDPREPCTPLAMVKRGHRYQITVKVTQPWTDGSVPADPIGVRRALWNKGFAGAAAEPREKPSWEARAWQWLGTPYRRVTDSRYMQPVVRLRAHDEQTGLLPRSMVHSLDPVSPDGENFTDVFDAPADGELFIYVNDAALFCGYQRFYENNRGAATITLHDLDAAPDPTVVAKMVERAPHRDLEGLWFNPCRPPARTTPGAASASDQTKRPPGGPGPAQ